jgi:hypothetical protein
MRQLLRDVYLTFGPAMIIDSNSFLKWLRIAVAAISISSGLLVLSFGLIGEEPIRFGFGKYQFFQVMATPPSLWLFWGILGLVIGVVLLAPSLLSMRKGH